MVASGRTQMEISLSAEPACQANELREPPTTKLEVELRGEPSQRIGFPGVVLVRVLGVGLRFRAGWEITLITMDGLFGTEILDLAFLRSPFIKARCPGRVIRVHLGGLCVE